MIKNKINNGKENIPYRFRIWNDFKQDYLNLSYRLNTEELKKIKDIKEVYNNLMKAKHLLGTLFAIPIHFKINYNLTLNDTLYLILKFRNELDPNHTNLYMKNGDLKSSYLWGQNTHFIKESISWAYNNRNNLFNLFKQKRDNPKEFINQNIDSYKKFDIDLWKSFNYKEMSDYIKFNKENVRSNKERLERMEKYFKNKFKE